MTSTPEDRAPRWRLLVAAAIVGALAGVGGILLTLLLHAVQWLAFGGRERASLDAAMFASPLRRSLAVAVGGVLVSVAWWRFRRRMTVVSVATALGHEGTPDERRMGVVPTFLDACLQICAVGTGLSLGREAAPRQVGAAMGGWVSRQLRLDGESGRLVLAAGAGAGLSAVYNVPVAGFLFVLEPLLRWRSGRAILPAAIASGVATVTAWPVLGRGSVYAVGQVILSWRVLVLALLVGASGWLVAVAFRWLTARARTRAPRGAAGLAAMISAFLITAVVAWWLPVLMGNGKSLAQLAFNGVVVLPLAVALMVAKPILTSASLAGGATGGMLQPSIGTGAVLGVALATLPVARGHALELAIMGGIVVLAIVLRMPVTAIALGIEFTAVSATLWPAILLAVGTAWSLDWVLARIRRGRPTSGMSASR